MIILQKAPKDRLLVYKVSEGWEPLCEFLGVKVPDKPFPHRNMAGNVIEELKTSNKIAGKLLMQGIAGASMLTLVAGYAGYKFCKSELIGNAARWFCESLTSSWR